MAVSRRDILVGLAASLAWPGVPALAAPAQRLYAAARKAREGAFSFAIFNPTQGELTAVELPGRGHGISVSPDRSTCVVFARRPGRFAAAVRTDGKAKPLWFETRPDRHFYGHGCFSPDGKLLLSAENDFDGERGVIGIRDATDGFKQVGEIPSHGIGPHYVEYLSDRRTLVIANGALLTHPDSGRAILNLSTMKPSLVYVDSHTGDLLEEHVLAPELHQLSIRHLTIAADDTVVFGGQHQGPLSERPPLIGFHRRGSKVEMVEAPGPVQVGLRNYIGSVAGDPSRSIAAASSPQGGIVTYWDIASRRYLGETKLGDVCGLAPGQGAGGFLLTSGEGAVELLTPGQASSLIHANPALEAFLWDNHAAAI